MCGVHGRVRRDGCWRGRTFNRAGGRDGGGEKCAHTCRNQSADQTPLVTHPAVILSGNRPILGLVNGR